MVIDQTQLRPGTAGEAIMKLHRQLGLLGFDVPAVEIDEDRYGPGTEAAIKQFQAANNLPISGVVDETTRRGLGLGGYPASIAGLVCRPDGIPLSDIAVQLYQATPQGDTLVANTRSGADGKFTLSWPAGASGGLTIHADGATGKAITWRTAQSSGAAWVRLTIGGEYRGASRFALLDAAMPPATEPGASGAVAPLQVARLNAVAEAARLPSREVSRHALARKLAARTSVDPSVLFALFTQRDILESVPTSAALAHGPAELGDSHADQVLATTLRHHRDELRIALQAAIADNVVGELDVDAAVAQLHALKIDHLAAKPLSWRLALAVPEDHPCCEAPVESAPLADDPGEGDGDTLLTHAASRPLLVHDAPLRDVLAVPLPDPADQRRVVEALAAHDSDARLGQVADAVTGLTDEQRADLRFTLEVAALVGNHLPLVMHARRLRAGKVVERASDLARFDEADWASLLRETDPAAEHIALPAGSRFAIAKAGQRIEELARLLARRLEILYPTSALAGRLASDRHELPLSSATGVQRFLERARSFCVRHTHIDRFVHDAGGELSPTGEDPAPIIADLKRLQRAYKLTPRFDHVKAMLAAGHNSAYSVYATGPERFAAQMASSGATQAEAKAMFAQAEQVHATTLTLVANFHSAFTGATPAAVAQPMSAAAIQALASFPTVQSLFGPNDYCGCSDCRAIHGPAAYLVDLLEFLKGRAATGGFASARAALFGRRPDLAQIELSCANTNGIVPYVDLVCEVLEDAIGAAPAATDVRARQTSGTTDELRANPVFVRDSAYAVLRNASFPSSAPFDLYIAEIRAYLSQIGVPWHELMAALQGSSGTGATQIAAERLGINPRALNILTTASPAQPWSLWGLGQNNAGTVAAATFVGAGAVVSSRSATIAFTPPTGMLPGDTLLFFTWTGDRTASSLTGALPTGWSQVQRSDAGQQTTILLRRIVTATEPGTHTFNMTSTGSGAALVGVAVAYRGLDPTASPVALAITTVDASATTFTCPSLATTTYSDAYIGFVADRSSTATATVPAGTTKRVDGKLTTNGGAHCAAFDLFPQAAGATGAQSVTLSAASTGVAMAYAFAKSHDQVQDPRGTDLPAISGDWLTLLAFVPILLDRAKIKQREIVQLLETKFINQPNAGAPSLSLVEAGTTIGTTDNYASCNTGKQSVQGWTSDLVTRFVRFVRLWRQLRCTIWDLDKILCASGIANGTLDGNAIVQIGRLFAIADRLGGPWDELLTLWGEIDHYNYVNVLDEPDSPVPSVYRRRFRNATVTQASTVFPDDTGALTGTVDSADAIAGFTAALDLSVADLARIRAHAGLTAGAALNVANLSTIARYAILADRLHLSISDLITAITLTAVNPFANATGTLSFLAALDQVRVSGFGLLELNYLLRHGSAIDSGIGLTDTTITAWLEDLRKALVRLNGTAAQSADLVVQRLSAALPLDPDLTQLVLQARMPGATQAIAALFTDSNLTALNDGSFSPTTTRTSFGAIYDAYTALDKMRLVLGRWKVRTADAKWLLQHAAGAGWIELHTLPASAGAVSGSSPTLATLDILRQNIVVQQSLAAPDGTRLFDFVLTPGADVAAAAGKIAPLGGWATSDITALAGRLNLMTASSLVAGATVPQIRDLMAWPRRLGTDVPTTLAFVPNDTANLGATDSRKARQIAKAQFSNDQWLGIAGAIQDRVREQKRAALVDYLLSNPNPARNQRWVTSEDLYGYYLIDPEMSPVATTTRIKQAAASVQLFVQRAMLQLEANVTVDGSNDSVWNQWDWMKRFRLWEANRKIFLYPENWFDPTQRHDTSSYFLDLVNALQQTDLTNDIAEDALREYLHKLSDVSHLEVSGAWEEPIAGTQQSILHVVARTRKSPYVYSYRRREAAGSWSPWEPLDTGVDTQFVMPAIWNRRLFLFWTEFVDKALPIRAEDRKIPATSSLPKDTVEPSKYYEIAAAWLERRNDVWLPKRLSQRKQLITAAPARREVAFRISTPSVAGTSKSTNLSLELYEPTIQTAVPTPMVAQWLFTSAQDEPVLLNTDLTPFGSIEEARYIGTLTANPQKMGTRPKLGGQPMTWHFNAFGGDAPSQSGILEMQHVEGGSVPTKTALNQISRARVIGARFGDNDQFKSPFFVSDPQRTFFAALDNSGNWLMQTFYHPFVQTFVQQLNSGGVAGLYDRGLQINPDSLRDLAAFDFKAVYKPADVIINPAYPTETIDYTPTGPYSVYNWELFLHTPLLIAKKLADNQRFSEALSWFHYIFNPTTTTAGDPPARYWNPKVFRDLSGNDYLQQQIENLLLGVNSGTSALVQQVTNWRSNPFDPNLVASARPVAYQKAVVMQYISTLIAWGDQLFRGDTIESINEATQLYLLASQLLGPRPQNVRAVQPRQSSTYGELQDHFDSFSNDLVDIENVVSVPPPGLSVTPPLPSLHTFYFCIPPNDQMLRYWDVVADRLFKVRHGLNLEGIARPLALYEPPIDPGLLVRAAAAGLDISTALADTSVELMCYRFNTLWQIAHDLCQDVRGLGSAILSALERRDGEEMARLRATQEIGVLDAVRQVKQRQLDDARANRTALQSSHDMAVARRDYYASRVFMNPAELQAQGLINDALDLDNGAVFLDSLTAIVGLIPMLNLGVSGFGGTPHGTGSFGGENLARNASAVAAVLRGRAGIKSQRAGLSNTIASYQRRQDDWNHQKDLADKEIAQIDKQLISADIKIAIAEQELNVHLRQIDDAKTNAELLHSKFTNQELYDWMVSQLSSTYFHAYQLAYDLAKRAGKAFSFELGMPDPGFIQFGYWDSLHKGLVAGDKLLLDLRRLQAEHLNRNKRELELTKHVSLLQLDANALVQLRKTGTCKLTLPEAVFDLDQPGHYYRRLKSVSVTLPCVTGPYTTINATLTLLSHSTRVTAVPATPYDATSKASDNLPNDNRFVYSNTATPRIALSTGREDAGMFEVNFHDDRYLPFEYLGAISTWQLDLPTDTNQFDMSTLSDVVLHLRYTARSDDALRGEARKAVIQKLPRLGVQLLSAKTEFPDAYARLFAPTGTGQRLDLAIGPDHFPFIPTTQKINIASISVVMLFTDDKTYGDYPKSPALKAHVGFTPNDGSLPTATATFTENVDGLPIAKLDLTPALAAPITVGFVEADIHGTALATTETVNGTTHDRLDGSKLDDLVLVVSYQIAAKG